MKSQELRGWLQVIALPLAALAVGYLGGQAKATHEAEMQRLDIAAQILANDSASASFRREWARKEFMRYSGVTPNDTGGGERSFFGFSVCDSTGKSCDTQILGRVSSGLGRPLPVQGDSSATRKGQHPPSQ